MHWAASHPFDSFSEQFKRPPPILTSSVTATTVKGLTTAEISSSGPSFQFIEKLDPSSLKLPKDHRDLAWASLILSSHGPVGGEAVWDRNNYGYFLPRRINSETDTMLYVENAFLKRAVAAAICLFDNAYDIPPEAFPGDYDILNQSTVGPSGRADRSIVRCLRCCIQIEGKTCKSATTAGNRSVFKRIAGQWLYANNQHPMDPPNSPIRPPGDINWFREPWEKKAQKILFQTWHQLITRSCQHAILVTEDEFVLALRAGNSLQLSQPFPFHGESQAINLEHMSFFIAHAFSIQFPNGTTDASPPPMQPIAILGSTSESPNPSGETPHSQMEGSSNNDTAALSFMQDVANNILTAISSRLKPKGSPLSLVFTTSGMNSTAIPLTLTVGISANPSLPGDKIILDRRLYFNQDTTVFGGKVSSLAVVAKIVEPDVDDSLGSEFNIYMILKKLQGSSIPRCYGVFTIRSACRMLLLQDCGSPLKSFSGLKKRQRQKLLEALSHIHDLGILHNDLQPQNILVSRNGVRISDFGVASRSHQCLGIGHCPELQDMQSMLELA